jgi:C4-dicarboxylate transporter, DctM subunit
MSGPTLGVVSVAALFVLMMTGVHIPVAFLLVSFGCVWILRGDPVLAIKMLGLSASDSIEDYVFGVIPLFVLMGLAVMVAGLGRDSYKMAYHAFRRIPGSLGHATVGGNAIFAAVTGVSVASATIFTKLAVPEMLRYGYSPRFATGVVGGSSVLGMLIPPSVLFILFGVITEVSIGTLFIAGIVPGLILSAAYMLMIIGWAWLRPQDLGRTAQQRQAVDDTEPSVFDLFKLGFRLLPLSL